MDVSLTAGDPGTLRVAIVAPSLKILGGQAVAAQRLLARLSDIPGLEVSLLEVNPSLPGFAGRLQRIKYIRTIVTSMAYVRALFRTVPTVDVLHVFSASYWSFLLAPAPAIVIGRCFGKAVIVNYRSGEARDHLSRFGWHVRPLLRLAQAIVTPSEYLVDVFAEFGLKAEAIHNFVETERIPFRPRRRLAPVLFANRNFEPLYNVAAILDAFAAVQARFPEASLILAGDGSLRSLLERQVSALGLEHVTFLGRVAPEQMLRLYDDADIYINASVIDNMPQSLVEAYAAGVPVVTSDAGGIPYIARDDEIALVVPTHDAAALGAAVLRLLRDPDLVERLTTQARQECLARYRWDVVRDKWLALYRRVAA